MGLLNLSDIADCMVMQGFCIRNTEKLSCLDRGIRTTELWIAESQSRQLDFSVFHCALYVVSL
jgi:hypothetical protein